MDHARELARAEHDGIETQVLHLFHEVRVFRQGEQFPLQGIDDFARRLLRDEHPVPVDHVQVREAAIGKRGNIRQRLQARGFQRPDRAQAPVAQVLLHGARRLHHELHVARDQAYQRRTAAAVGYVGHFDSRLAREHLGDEVEGVALARRAVEIFSRARLGERDELAQVFRIHLAVDHEQARIATDERHGDQVPLHVVGELGYEVLDDRDRRRRRKQQRVAVGRGAHHRLRADSPGSAADVFQHDLLPQPRRDSLRDQPADDIDAAARGKRGNQLDGAARILLCPRMLRQRACPQQRAEQHRSERQGRWDAGGSSAQ